MFLVTACGTSRIVPFSPSLVAGADSIARLPGEAPGFLARFVSSKSSFAPRGFTYLACDKIGRKPFIHLVL